MIAALSRRRQAWRDMTPTGAKYLRPIAHGRPRVFVAEALEWELTIPTKQGYLTLMTVSSPYS